MNILKGRGLYILKGRGLYVLKGGEYILKKQWDCML